MSDVEKVVGLFREHLVALAIMIGCDYCPKGVPGVGKAQAMKICSEIPKDEILKRLVKTVCDDVCTLVNMETWSELSSNSTSSNAHACDVFIGICQWLSCFF